TSGDCGPSFVCFATGTGGNYCVSSGAADRAPPANGGAGPGASCATPTDCRSGLCSAAHCLDTCCTDQECAAGTVGTVTKFDGMTALSHDGWGCRVPDAGALDVGEPCAVSKNCKNLNCEVTTYPSRRCAPSCCSAKSCAALGFTDNVCLEGTTA